MNSGQIEHLRLDVGHLCRRHRAHIATAPRWIDAKVEELANLLQRKSEIFRAANEPEPTNGVRRILAVTRPSPRRFRDQPFSFVEADRLDT